MNKQRHYKEELQSIDDYDKRKEAHVREKRLFMERWGLLPDYEDFFSECALHQVEVQLKNVGNLFAQKLMTFVGANYMYKAQKNKNIQVFRS